MNDLQQDLERIQTALDRAREILTKYTPGAIEAKKKAGGSPVTEADTELDTALREILPSEGEGWLSEETRDDPSRLEKSRVWIVDPLDGTKEFVTGIPEWCVSVGLVKDGVPIAGGILSPSTDHLFLGAVGAGVTLNGESARPTDLSTLEGARVLASRSEVDRGEWCRFDDSPIDVITSGSVALKLARVAAGLEDATWTLVPKNEWDLAGGVALIMAGGGSVKTLDWRAPRFNERSTLFKGLIASGAGLIDEIGKFLELS